MYRPRSRSRSRSPDYRYRRFSPSRPVSRSPPPPPRERRYENDAYPPPPWRYDDDYRGGPPPPRRYEDDYPPRRYDDRRDRERDRSPPRPIATSMRDDWRRDDRDRDRDIPPPRIDRDRAYDRDRDRDRDRDPRRPVDRYDGGYAPGGMAADREEVRARNTPPIGPRDYQPTWERGRDVDELQAGEVPVSRQEPSRKTAAGGPSDPNVDVICIGLDEELTETDLMGFLRTEHKAEVNSVKIIRKKFADTGRSNCLAFVNFATLDGAQEFIDHNYPAILMPALYAHSEPRKVRIDFAQPQAAPVPAAHDPPAFAPGQTIYVPRAAHDGMRDIGQPGGGKRVLLFRGLDLKTTPDFIIRRVSQEIAKMLGRYGLEKQAEQAIHRVAMIVDKVAGHSWGLCFLELATAELASALVPFLTFPQYQPQGFIIAEKAIAPSFAASESFLPTPAGPLGSQYLLRATRKGGIGNETIDKPDGQWVGYWHEQGGILEKIPMGIASMPENGDPPEMTPDLRLFLGHLAGVYIPPVPVGGVSSGITTPNEGLLNMSGGGLIPIKIGGAALGLGPIKQAKKKEIEAAIVPLNPKNVLGDEEETDMVGKDTVLLSRTPGAQIIIPTSGRKIAKEISKWNSKSKELAAPISVDKAPSGPKGISEANRTIGIRPPPQLTVGSSAPEAPKASTSTTPVPIPNAVASPKRIEDDFDYTDLSTMETIVCEAGRQRKIVALQRINPGLDAAGASASASAYRDRAAERRTVFNQPDKPSYQELQALQPPKRKYVEALPATPAPIIPEKGVAPGEDTSNMGNQLLAKMGWASGTGLGKEGEGRVEPVLVQQFETRAGLGASKGVEPGRYEGPEGFKRRALDMAERRYGGGST